MRDIHAFAQGKDSAERSNRPSGKAAASEDPRRTLAVR